MSDTRFSSYLGITVQSPREGHAEARMELAPQHRNRRGVAHGGVVSALLDTALGGAVVSAIPAEWWCATTSLSIEFLDGAREGELVATGRVLRRGRTTAFAAGEVRDAEGRLIATAQGSWHLWPHHPGAAPPAPAHHVVMRGSGERIRVGKILAIGRNYSDHIAEMGAPPDAPAVLFLKPATAILHDGGTVLLPAGRGEVNYEVELVAVVGETARAVDASRALGHVLGFAVGLDMTLREAQKRARAAGEPWAASKGFDTSAPVSLVAPREAVGDGTGLALTLDVNGVRRQQANTSEMIRPVAEIISWASRLMTLEPGDLVFTGTPAGVGSVSPGDALEARIEKVGCLRVRVEAERSGE